ncbi:OmpA family protein [Spirosomataceae bacterium TFI 002]|nr:OmpA family protein [Spirosomataceae bacterium TFI 002]
MKKVLLLCILFSQLNTIAQDPKEILQSIYFGGGSWYIGGEQAGDLKEIVNSIKNLPYYEITVTSHTDNIGGKEFNAYLSRMRSEAAMRLLERFGVNPETVKYKDFGEEAPVFDNSTITGKLRNRRVDILFKPIQF